MLKQLEKTYREYFPKQLKSKGKYADALKNGRGIEIGGPSQIFESKGLLPLYEKIGQLDGCNFSNDTVWEGKLKEGKFFTYNNGKGKGHQYIADATDLSIIQAEKYDFVLSCHNLEHIANPLRALHEWKRILKPGGFLVLVLPLRSKTFDHNRPVTTISHIVDDYKNNITEKDDTHFEEVITLHDISLDEGIQSQDELRKRTIDNFTNRCLHHHVFEPQLVQEVALEAGFQPVSLDVMYHNIFLLGQKTTS